MRSSGEATIGILLFSTLYLAAIILVVRAVPTGEHGWAMTAAILVLLLIEKLLELPAGQAAITVIHAQGMDHQRRAMQSAFVLGIAAAGFLCFLLAILLTRGLGRIALATAILLGAFAFVRGSSFYRIEAILGASVGPVRVRHVIEVGALALIALVAFRARERMGPKKRSRKRYRR